MRRLPLTEAPPEGDLPINAHVAAFAVTNAKTRKEAVAAMASTIMLNRIVLNHYRKEALSAPKEQVRPKRPILRIKRHRDTGGEDA